MHMVAHQTQQLVVAPWLAGCYGPAQGTIREHSAGFVQASNRSHAVRERPGASVAGSRDCSVGIHSVLFPREPLPLL